MDEFVIESEEVIYCGVPLLALRLEWTDDVLPDDGTDSAATIAEENAR